MSLLDAGQLRALADGLYGMTPIYVDIELGQNEPGRPESSIHRSMDWRR
jgi:hypothetical protein